MGTDLSRTLEHSGGVQLLAIGRNTGRCVTMTHWHGAHTLDLLDFVPEDAAGTYVRGNVNILYRVNGSMGQSSGILLVN